MKSEKLPHWFDIERYKIGLVGKSRHSEAMLAVLDRVAFYRVVTDLSFDPVSVDAANADAAQKRFLCWLEHPYRRADDETRAALWAALPAVTEDIISAFNTLLVEAEEQEREASQRELHRIVDRVAHLSADEQWRAVEEKVRQRSQWQAQSNESVDLPEPVHSNRADKLLRYRAAAYMDLVIWGALTGTVPDTKHLEKSVHVDRRLADDPAYPRDWRSVVDLLKQLKDEDLGFHLRIDAGDTFRDALRNDRRRKGQA